jgi:hypothetical protein
MSATRCKIIICGNEAANASLTSAEIAEQIEKDPDLAKRLIERQEKYVSDMHCFFAKVTSNV